MSAKGRNFGCALFVGAQVIFKFPLVSICLQFAKFLFRKRPMTARLFARLHGYSTATAGYLPQDAESGALGD
jgi:hypothetical protein